MTDECVYCGATDAPDGGIVVVKAEQGGDTTCNVCLADHLQQNTVLSKREAEVAALKLQGHRHETIAELIQTFHGEDKPVKSTVNEYSRRMKEKVKMTAETVNSLEKFL